VTNRQMIDVDADLAAPVETVWGFVEDVTTWTDWAGFSEAAYAEEGSPDRHGLGAVRRFRIGPLRSHERVLTYEPPFHLAYDYDGSLPIRDYRADVTLVASDEGTHVAWHAEFTPTVPLTGTALRLFLASAFRRMLAGLDRTTG
jgi:carbon monoxide dehydrogenase subunit G